MMNKSDNYTLKGCSEDNPFAFVSYSWKDSDLVHADVAYLQEQGYNIWIDVQKMKERKEVWNEQALKRIHDIDCKLLIFFVSSNSLESENCLKECEAAFDKETCETHNGPLDVLLVDVQDVNGKVSEWITELQTQVTNSRQKQKKDERTLKATTLYRFGNFFSGDKQWDNKIRIKAKTSLGEEEYYSALSNNLTEIKNSSDELPEPYEDVKDTLFKKIHAHNPNVWLTTKENTERKTEFNFYERLYGTQHLTLVNFAGTSFIAGIDVGSVYKSAEKFREWFEKHIIDKSISATIILTNPFSTAAEDAENYKMYPSKRKCAQEDIIRMNLTFLMNFCKNYPEADLNVYVTDIALPYGIMLAENFENPDYDYMKVDIYAPVIADDNLRPSFYLLKCDEETHELYNFFKNNVENIRTKYAQSVKDFTDISWLCDKRKPVIHRGILTKDLKEHTLSAYRACIAEGRPMEVDLLEMSDGELVVYRDQAVRMNFGTVTKEKMLSKFSLDELFHLLKNKTIEEPEASELYEMLTLREFLNLVDGRVNLIIELKDFNEDPDAECHTKLARKTVDSLKGYLKYNSGTDNSLNGYSRHNSGKLAIHSSNPYVLREIRKINCLIPIGQISLDYTNVDVSEEYRRFHHTAGFLSVIKPDFISYSLETLQKNKELREMIYRVCHEQNIPLICWAAKSDAERNFVMASEEIANCVAEFD